MKDYLLTGLLVLLLFAVGTMEMQAKPNKKVCPNPKSIPVCVGKSPAITDWTQCAKIKFVRHC